MRDNFTGRVVTKDFGNTKIKETYPKTFGYKYTFYHGEFTQPYIDYNWLNNRHKYYDYIAYSEVNHGKHTWKLFRTHKNVPELNFTTNGEFSLMTECFAQNVNIARIFWHKDSTINGMNNRLQGIVRL